MAGCRAVIGGFVRADALDSKPKAWPDLDATIHTCQGAKTLDDQATVHNTFKDVCARTLEHGHVTDERFDVLGCPRDRDATGKTVERLSKADHLQ